MPVMVWTGLHSQALRLAYRMSVRQFAHKMGVSERCISKWESAGLAIRPKPINQEGLDVLLRWASVEQRRRFRMFVRRELRSVRVGR